MKWINFLHLYQPVNADPAIIKEAAEKSYYRIVSALEKSPRTKFTINITGCLLMRLDELGYGDLIKRINKLVKKGQIELVGSAAYHALLPLMPVAEIKKQIRENELFLEKYFGRYKLRGFFLPEMAYNSEAAKIIKSFGYQWIMLSEIAYNGKLNSVDFNKVYQDKTSNLKVIFRSRAFSKCYVPSCLLEKIKNDKNGLYITATDGELYGLRHIDHGKELEKLLKRKKLQTTTISEFIGRKEIEKKIIPRPCSWESTEEEMSKNNPYALWHDKKNKIQQDIWQLARLAYNIVEGNKKDKNYHFSRWHLVRGLASCTFWWASAKDFRLFSPISWSPDEIERGVNELVRAVRTLDSEKTRAIKIKAEKIHIRIKHDIWTKHWAEYWKK